MKRYSNLLFWSVITTNVLCLAAAIWTPIFAQEHTPDQHTILLLHCNDNLSGTQGETPTQATGISFEPGIFGKGAYFPAGNQLYYASAGNINSTQGTVEFWIKPKWHGNDGQGYVALKFGTSGGIYFAKDGGNNWRSIFNRFGSGGNPELGVGINVGKEWQANQWHHCAFTWNATSIKLYVDGVLRSSAPVAFPLPAVNETTFQLGAEGTAFYLNAVIDELRISDIERSSAEIRASYLAGIMITALTIKPDSIALLKTWWKTPVLTASTNLGSMNIPVPAAQWSSANSAIATVAASGRITAIAAGQTMVTASYQSRTATGTVIVKAPVLPPVVESISSFLATPAPNHLFEIPVVIIRYFPTVDGINVDPVLSELNSSLQNLEAKIDRDAIHTKFMLEEGSRFHGYKNSAARPALGYRVVHIVTVYEELPLGFEIPGSASEFFPDYDQILARFDAENFVNNLGVREFWLWGYHNRKLVPVESNMSSPTTGDISNSHRFNNDMPIFNHTYTLYNYNFTRGPNENVHNHGHQLEAILSHANWLQDRNIDLFWKKFVGQDVRGNFITGRCGWTHMPPNTTQHYDYANMTPVESDIEDWTPEGNSRKKSVNALTWRNLLYQWPNNDPPVGDLTETHWYIYWMQNMPGRENTIRYGERYLTNWWAFTGDWDGSIKAGLGLYESTPTAVREMTSEFPSSFILQQNYPNPFWSGATSNFAANPSTMIEFSLRRPGHVTLKVYNVLGEEIATLVNKNFNAGRYQVNWDAKGAVGGVYFYRLQSEGVVLTKKMMVLR